MLAGATFTPAGIVMSVTTPGVSSNKTVSPVLNVEGKLVFKSSQLGVDWSHVGSDVEAHLRSEPEPPVISKYTKFGVLVSTTTVKWVPTTVGLKLPARLPV